VSVLLDLPHREELRAFRGNGGCINCGACTAVCPLPREEVMLPRKVIRYIHLGRVSELIDNAETVFSCLLCRLCEQTCPAGVDIAAYVRFLRTYINHRAYGLTGDSRNVAADQAVAGDPRR
jgi:heterodisulfide reductase subunit C